MTNKVTVLFFVIIAIWSQANAQYFSRVVGGSPTTISLYPIVAQLLLDTWGNQHFVQHCAGVIVTSRHVISTAHCFQYNFNTGRKTTALYWKHSETYLKEIPSTFNWFPIEMLKYKFKMNRDVLLQSYTHPKYWKIRAGSSFRSQGGVIHSLKNIIPHPEFNKYFYTNDVAVIVVSNKFVFGSQVAQGTIAKPRSQLRDNSVVTLVGWGSMESTGDQAEQLQHTTMFTINEEECRTRYNTIGAAIVDSMMCAGKLDVGGADGCFGDSGGPLVYKGVIVGLVSFGYDCGHRYYPGVYTKVSHFTDWIVNTIANNK